MGRKAESSRQPIRTPDSPRVPSRLEVAAFVHLMTSLISILQAAWRENGGPAPATPGPAPSHTRHAPPQSARACGTYPREPSARGDNRKVARAPATHRSDEAPAPDLRTSQWPLRGSIRQLATAESAATRRRAA